MKNHSLAESFEKTILVIESCNNEAQLEGASRMVKNFKKLYGKFGYSKLLLYVLNRKLEQQLLKYQYTI